ncbi:hypothetical protein ACFFJT_02115 [Dyella flava]|uniref:Uncharacterized protein n=1 Tax=Dyella flava TaxID=1920170 RepID=A0ABS2K670_9GAMM|nr:hypothetical protein [Dyella flava]MBM7126205.1 hypothetical protein [Dyella flava]GLQ48989.1 hypothetical protein GCM10010872_04380 [Dyella flava]
MHRHDKDSRRVSINHLDPSFKREPRYRIHPNADTDTLLNNANRLLNSAQDITRILGDGVRNSAVVPPRHLSSALNGVAILIGMSKECTVQARRRMQKE